MKVGMSLGLTLNMGNYESARFDVSIEVDTTKEDFDMDYHHAKKWVEARIKEEETKWRNIKGG